MVDSFRRSVWAAVERCELSPAGRARQPRCSWLTTYAEGGQFSSAAEILYRKQVGRATTDVLQARRRCCDQIAKTRRKWSVTAGGELVVGSIVCRPVRSLGIHVDIKSTSDLAAQAEHVDLGVIESTGGVGDRVAPQDLGRGG